ncbi:MAG TPA: M48 family metalloprotease [Pyrinomonadaceae bacterium]|nr:M48 family metalloprotease [Pyrinomonadaceae bacterium]
MKHPFWRVVALLLTFLFTLPTPQLIAMAQEAQDQSQSQSKEEEKIRKAEEKRNKKEEERKRKESDARAREMKKYSNLTDFALDLYASNSQFRDYVDDCYLDLQRQHASEAYRLNTSHTREVLRTENDGELLIIRRALYDNPRVQEYVNRLGQQIVPEDSDKLYTFKVTVNPIPEAHTLSTGTVLISTGMISLLDNEAQLAYVLAHELAHVYKDHWRLKMMLPIAELEYNRRQEEKRLLWASLFGLAGAGIGAVAAGGKGAAIGAGAGLLTGYAVGSYYSQKIGLDWNVAQENEADDFALRATLGKSFDIQEVPRLYTAMAQVAGVDNRTQLGFLGSRKRIRERNEYAQGLINGALQAQYQEGLSSNKLKGVSPEFNLIMAELKRDNGIEAFYYDMFQMARKNLQQSVMMRSDDPLAAYYYARVMKQVGRTKEELELAQQSLLKAISLDTRQEIPEIQLHRALMLMDSKDTNSNSEAITSLKNYITAYERKRATMQANQPYVPPNLDVLYGYMRLLGDKTWTAPNHSELQKASMSAPVVQPQAPAPIPASQQLSPNSTRKPNRP